MKSRKRTTAIAIALAATITVTACDSADDQANQDVYTKLEDCVADWGDKALCERQLDREMQQQQAAAQANAQAGGGPAIVPMVFMGPTYYGSDRTYKYSDGRTRRPMSYYSGKTPRGSLGTISGARGQPLRYSKSAVQPFGSSKGSSFFKSSSSGFRSGGFGRSGGGFTSGGG